MFFWSRYESLVQITAPRCRAMMVWVGFMSNRTGRRPHFEVFPWTWVGTLPPPYTDLVHGLATTNNFSSTLISISCSILWLEYLNCLSQLWESHRCVYASFGTTTIPLKIENLHDAMLCHQWRYQRLSSWQPPVPPVTTLLASWQLPILALGMV